MHFNNHTGASVNNEKLKQIIHQALQEDIGTGDITTEGIVPEDINLRGRFVAKAAGIVAGLEVVSLTFALLDEGVKINPKIQDGEKVEAGNIIAEISGPARAILTGERTALNLLQRMSGIATLTNRFVKAVEGTGAVILDTRKTAPGLRLLDKWAVRLGGGQNHRTGLYDMVLIKENHIAVAGSISEAVHRVRQTINTDIAIEVEVKNIDELREALTLEVDRILLDNMSLEDMGEAVRITGHKIPLEASGNVTLQSVRKIAETGVDYISAGILTHSVNALDISLLLQ